MKFLKLSLCLLILLLIFISGCNNTINNDSIKDTNYSEAIDALNENQKEINNKIAEKYKNINKELLNYSIYPSEDYFYETNNGFLTENLLDGSSKFSDKKYGEILTEYCYLPDVNPSSLPYDEAIKLIHSVLPDDIKEQRILHNKSLQKTYIVYSSIKGTFVAGLTHSVVVNSKGSVKENKDIVVGIDYLKDIP